MDYPDSCSPPMVRAILREIEKPGFGKTQMRRIVPQPMMTAFGWNIPWEVGGGVLINDQSNPETIAGEILNGIRIQVGDRLWVREACRVTVAGDDGAPDTEPPVWYLADGGCPNEEDYPVAKSTRDMPRWASRITLIVTDVRVQRLQDMPFGDLLAEGIDIAPPVKPASRLTNDEQIARMSAAFDSFGELWDALHEQRGCAWEDDPWVAAYTFRPILGNIDAVRP